MRWQDVIMIQGDKAETEKSGKRKRGGGAAQVKARRERWRGVIDAWASSGMTQAEFCRRRGITQEQFCRWKRHLVRLGLRPRAGGAGGRPARPNGRRRAAGIGSPAFAAVGEAPAAILTGLVGASEEAMTLVLPGGWRVGLGRRFGAAALGRLLGALSGQEAGDGRLASHANEARAGVRQHLLGATVADGEVRGGLSEGLRRPPRGARGTSGVLPVLQRAAATSGAGLPYTGGGVRGAGRRRTGPRGGADGCWNSSRPTGSFRSSNRRTVRLS